MATALLTPEVEPVEALPADDPFDNADHHEIIDGVKVELPPMSANSSVFASRLAFRMTAFAMPAGLGEAHTEVMFKLPLNRDRQRRPDVAFVPYSRWARDRPIPDTNAWNVLPDLCVEVVSPTNRADEAREKVEEYLEAGVRLVWVIYPRQQIVDVYESAGRVRALHRADDLDGGSVLPGFHLRLADLFPAQPPVEPRPDDA